MFNTPQDKPSCRLGVMKFFITLAIVGACILLAEAYEGYKLPDVDKSTDEQTSESNHEQTWGAKHTEGFEKAIESMTSYSNLMVNWSIILFGGTIGIVILGRGARIRDNNWALVTIPPTWVLLAYSVKWGNVFLGKVSFQLYSGEYALGGLNLPLYLQQQFFNFSLVPLIVFAMVYLFFRLALLENKSDK